MSSYNASDKKIEDLWYKIEKIQADIITNDSNNKILLDTVFLSQPITEKMSGALDLSSDWILMTNDTTTTGDPNDFLINFQIIFERIDIRMIPFFNTKFIYRVGNNEEENKFIDDPLFHPTNQGRLLPNGGHTNETVQEIEIPGEDDNKKPGTPPSNMRRVIYNRSLLITQNGVNTLPDFEIKLNAKFLNPHIYY